MAYMHTAENTSTNIADICDFHRMKTEDVHTDLQFLGGTYMTGGHKIMLKCR